MFKTEKVTQNVRLSKRMILKKNVRSIRENV